MGVAISIVAIALLAIGAAALRWWPWPEPAARPRALERDWNAAVMVFAGDGVPGSTDGDADHARFSDPFGVAAAPDGSIVIADAGGSQAIRRISPAGATVTIAGGRRGFADGIGTAAAFDAPSGVAIGGDGTIYVADTANNAIRRVTPDGHVSTIAGGEAGYADGTGRDARFNGPIGIAVDANGRVIVADTYNDRIRAIAPDGTVTTLAGGPEPGGIDGVATEARFDTPSGVAIDRSGTIFVADTGNGLVRAIDRNGNVSMRTSPSEGTSRPVGIASFGDDLFVTDDHGRVLEISSDGSGRIVAGSTPGFRDGAGADARFRRPSGIAAIAPGRLLVADADNALIRLVVARSQLELRLPPSPLIAPHFDVASFASEPLLWPVAPMDGPYEIAGTMGEARGGSGGERFHAGIDVRVDEGTPVRAVRTGVVTAPLANSDFGGINESVRVGPLTYIHVRVGRAPHNIVTDLARFAPTFDEKGKLIRLRVKRGARFETGDIVGSVNPFNHVHLNVGWAGEEYNPLQFRLVQFEDTVPPTIAKGGVRLFDEYGEPLTNRVKGRLIVAGRVQVVIDAFDQMNGNRPNRRLGLQTVGYQVLNADGAPVPGFEEPHESIRFDRLTADPEAPRTVYAPGSGIPFYGQRRTRFLYIVTNTFRGGAAATGYWDTSALAPGEYTLRIWAVDFAGNVATANRDLPVTILAPAGAAAAAEHAVNPR